MNNFRYSLQSSIVIPIPPHACRWLVDHDDNETGKAVILDLHGGDLENEEALREFQEIKDAVMKEVMRFESEMAPAY